MNFRSLRALMPGPADYARVPRSWKSDLMAGLTVGIVALPLALAFGVSSGAGAAAGLITAVIAGVVAAVFGGSNVQVSGPTGAMVVVLAPVIAAHGVSALAAVTILAGVFVVVAAVLKLGRVVTFLPWPVIEGFTVGIAIIIFLQQVPAAVGVSVAAGGNAAFSAVQAFSLLSSVPAGAVIASVGLVVLVAAVTLLAPRLSPKVPGSLVAIVLATAVAQLFDLPVASIGALPSALPAPALPQLNWDVLRALAGPALAIAALAAIESLLSARVAAAHSDTGPYDPDRELFGQGLASVASGVFGGMPATGAIARTAVNIRAGGRTRLAAIVHALVLLGVVALAAGPVSTVPLAALAGVLMVTATRMVAPSTVRAVLASSRADGLVFAVTAVVTVSFDLIEAVLVGLVVASFFALRSLVRSSGVLREEISGPPCDGDARIAVFRLDGALFFGAAEHVLDRVAAIRDVDVVVLRLSQLQMLDATGARVLGELVTSLERRGVTVLVKGIQPRHLRLLTNVGTIGALRDARHLFDDLPAAIEHARSHARRADLARRTTAVTELLPPAQP